MSYSKRVADAFALARKLHKHQRRKGSDTPYLTHLMAVAALVREYGGSEDQVVAALLHDAVEDQGGQETLDAIRAQFGEAVAGLVMAASDCDVVPKPPWRERKEAFIAALADANDAVKLIVAADKLHNVRSMLKDAAHSGDAFWERFHGGYDGTLWYLTEVLAALRSGWTHPILEELSDQVDNLRALR